MPLALSSTSAAKRESRPTNLTPTFGSAYSVAEINAYIAIRDQLLNEAEKLHSSAKVASTELANNFVEGCLKPGRSPYETQCLPESDAARERERCEAVRERLTKLRESVT